MHGKGGVGDGLLNVGCLDEREVILDLLKSPALADKAQEMLDGESMPAYAGSAAHLAWFEGDAIKIRHDETVPRRDDLRRRSGGHVWLAACR